MLDWIFEGIANWVASIMTQLMDAVSGLFLDALGTDMTAMEEYFPFVVSAYNIIQYTAWAILFLTVVWQLFRAFGGPITEAENPWQLLIRGGIFAVLIAYSKSIFSIVLDVARAPYLALMDSAMDPGDFTFAGIEQALTNGLVTFVSMVSVVGLLLLIIMMIALAWNYFKLLLETVERYVLVGVLCYTSPLAYSMGASKATSRVFQSWCRMVGSQLLLLVLNVWFLRAFNSSVGQFVANGGALTTGRGSIFLWLFCALALLKTAQKCDSHLAALGLSVAQTGSSMGMEMLMAARVITGFSKGGGQNASSAFGSAARGAASTGAAGTGAGGILSGFVNRYKPNSFVRDAVVDGGSRMGAGGSVGFVGRAFGGVAARNGATLTADSISSVASRPNKVSGTIAGEIADRSLPAYMPQLANGPTAGMSYSNTQITGGHISTTATGPDGRQSNVELFSSAQYDRPETPHTVVSAADGSQWYQVASGEGMSAFYAVPPFTGDQSEAAQVSEAFPNAPEGTLLRQAGEGTLEASYPDGSNAIWYSSAHYQEPDAPHETIQSSNGLDWYAMTPHAAVPQFDTGSESELSGQPPFNIGADGTAAGTGDSAMFGGDEPLSGMPVRNNLEELGGGVSSDILVNEMSAAELNNGLASTSPVAAAADETHPAPAADTITNGAPADIPAGGDENLVAGAPAGGIGKMPSMEVTEYSPSEPATVNSNVNVSGDVPSGGIPAVDSTFAPETAPAGSAAIPEIPAAGVMPAPEPPPFGGMSMPEPPPPVSELSADGGTFIPEPPSFSGAPMFDQPTSGSGQVDAPCVTGNVEAYNQALFGQFMPGFDRPAVSIDTSRAGDGILEVRHEDGSGTAFYDRTMYQQPRGDHRVFEDSSGGQWYAIPGTPAVERRPVYQDGKPVYDGDKLKTEMVETIRYKSTPARYAEPARRPARERKTPKKKT